MRRENKVFAPGNAFQKATVKIAEPPSEKTSFSRILSQNRHAFSGEEKDFRSAADSTAEDLSVIGNRQEAGLQHF